MIKCEVTISGAISRTGEMRTTREGKPFLSFFVCVNIVSRNGETLRQEIAVFYDKGDVDPTQFYFGRRVEMKGSLVFKKRGESMYANFSAESINIDNPAQEDAIKGNMLFRGSIGRRVETKNDKKGNPMLIFSAFSTEKVGEEFEYLWVRFVGFGIERQPWLEPKCKVEAAGELELSVYSGRLSISCRISEYKQYIPTPYNPSV